MHTVESLARELLGDCAAAHKDFVWPNVAAAEKLGDIVNDEDIGDDVLIGLFEYLLEKGGLREACDKVGFHAIWTADCDKPAVVLPILHFCAERTEFCKFLVKAGLCGANCRNSDGDTLFMSCASHPELGLWLWDNAGIDPLARNAKGEGFLHSASWAECAPDLIALAGRVIAAGASPLGDPADPGSGPIGCALSYSNDEFASFLLSKNTEEIGTDALVALADMARLNSCEDSLSILENNLRAQKEKQALANACNGAGLRGKAPGL